MRSAEHKPRQYVDYYKYLASPEWQAKKKAYKRTAFKHSGPKCKICCADRVSLSVHHKTYARLGNEHKSDLLAVCDWCHKLIHAVSTVGDSPRTKLPGNIKSARRDWWAKCNSEGLWKLRHQDPLVFSMTARHFFLTRFNLDENYKRPKVSGQVPTTCQV